MLVLFKDAFIGPRLKFQEVKPKEVVELFDRLEFSVIALSLYELMCHLHLDLLFKFLWFDLINGLFFKPLLSQFINQSLVLSLTVLLLLDSNPLLELSLSLILSLSKFNIGLFWALPFDFDLAMALHLLEQRLVWSLELLFAALVSWWLVLVSASSYWGWLFWFLNLRCRLAWFSFSSGSL